jgi:hypothetical protein
MRIHASGTAVFFSRLVAIVGAVFAVAASPAPAAPISIGFSGEITQVDDPGGVFAGLSVPAGRVDGVFTLDPTAGTVSFGDGTVGQLIPNGGFSVSGTYRYGGSGGGNTPGAVILFPGCFVGSVLGFECAPGEGRDAYVVDLPPLAGDGFVQSFVVALVGGIALGDTDVPSLLPPPLDTLDSAAFAWRFSTGDSVAVVTGVIDAIAAVPEPSSLLLIVIATVASAAPMARSRRRPASDRR